MKKEAVIFTSTLLAVTGILGIMGMSLIRGVYSNEIHTVQNLAGKVIAEYPETEITFMEAVGDMKGKKDADTGAEILSHYGYDEDEKIRDNPSYRKYATFFLLFLLAFFIVFLLYIAAFFYVDVRREKRQEEQILSILDNCLSGDYCFVDDEDRMKMLRNPFFADALVKLGKGLRLKTEWLEEEHDNTKMLVTDISHQLRTPVSALMVCFSLYTEAEEEEEKEEFLARCRIQMDKVEMLTEALTHISSLETHIIRLQPTPVPLVEILLEAVNVIYHKASKKQISIDTTEFEELELCLDKKWTVEAVANVLDNAVKYSPVGSTIKMRVKKLVHFVRVEIEDNGIGIPREEQNQIFRRFYRGSSEVVKKEEGVGVGLYLSRKILEEEGGTIFVRPAEKGGSVFVMQLPLTA